MTTAFSTNDSGDMVRVNGRFVRIDAVEQRIAHKLRLLHLEWFLDRTAGVPYIDDIMAGKINIGHVRQIFRTQIATVEGVNQINELELSFDSPIRVLTIRFRVNGGEDTTISVGVPG